MREAIQMNFDIIMAQRSWSWAVVALIYVLLTLMVRGWFLNILFRRTRKLDKKAVAELQRVYLKRALIGWFFYILSVSTVILIWNPPPNLPAELTDTRLSVIGAASFVIALLFHLQAFALGAISLLTKSKDA